MLLNREELEAREDRILAPYAMRSRSSLGARHPEPTSRYRTAFQRDRDRIVHSTAFRRLEYKTQVFVNHEGDHYRTRLTHTLEVAQISRSIARALGLNEDLVEAVALAHDLGHPPFGHAGEEALDQLMKDHGGFNHNRQSLRVVDLLETRYPEFAGLNLSWEIRESIAKHGKSGPEGVDKEFHPDWAPLIEAQVADLADSLAYDSHDIDDGLRSRFLTFADLRELRLWRQAEADLAASRAAAEPPAIDEKIFIARMASHLIDRQVCDLLEATHERLRAHRIDSVEAVRRHRAILVGFSPEMQAMTAELEAFLSRRLYNHYRTLKMAEKAKRFIIDIFQEYRRHPLQLPPDFQKIAERDGIERAICDYIAGMTDRFCQDEYKRMFHPFERM